MRLTLRWILRIAEGNIEPESELLALLMQQEVSGVLPVSATCTALQVDVIEPPQHRLACVTGTSVTRILLLHPHTKGVVKLLKTI